MAHRGFAIVSLVLFLCTASAAHADIDSPDPPPEGLAILPTPPTTVQIPVGAMPNANLPPEPDMSVPAERSWEASLRLRIAASFLVSSEGRSLTLGMFGVSLAGYTPVGLGLKLEGMVGYGDRFGARGAASLHYRSQLAGTYGSASRFQAGLGVSALATSELIGEQFSAVGVQADVGVECQLTSLTLALQLAAAWHPLTEGNEAWWTFEPQIQIGWDWPRPPDPSATTYRWQ